MTKTKKRHKQHTIKSINAPITRPLIEHIELCSFLSLVGLKQAPSHFLYDNVANYLNWISLATVSREDLTKDFVILASGALALTSVRERIDRLGIIRITDQEYITVSNAFMRFRDVLQRLDMRTLKLAEIELNKFLKERAMNENSQRQMGTI